MKYSFIILKGLQMQKWQKIGHCNSEIVVYNLDKSLENLGIQK